MIAWTIEAALASQAFSRLILSTDDEEIAETGRTFGAEVPFLRPAELGQDKTSALDVTIHLLDWLRENGGEPDYVFLLQPTSPLRTADDIRGAIDLTLSRRADAAIAITEASPHPFLARTMADDGTLDYLVKLESKPTSRHEYPRAWLINGAAYFIRSEVLRRDRTFQPPGTLGFVMPPERSLDIDTPWELHLANLILSSTAEAAR
jgi:CMP-N-acetylneuraminic acid synthetase